MERDACYQLQKYREQQFQLTRSRGARLTSHVGKTICLKFQLTRSRGARLNFPTIFILNLNFNSRAHVERDGRRYYFDMSTVNFNSRAHVERDLSTCYSLFLLKQFQLTRSRGARPMSKAIEITNKTFQLTRSRGARHREWAFRLDEIDNFNSRAHVERDRTWSTQ